ncbi:GntR family transcriptional regulator [Arcanobacterium canis]
MTKHKLKHQKIALYLEHLIRRGRLSTGDPLPSENELAKKFKVSRGTVRKAISNLQNKKLIRTDQGRGSFVAVHTQSPDDVRGWIESLSTQGAEMTVNVVSISLTENTELPTHSHGSSTFIEIIRTWSLPSGTIASMETSLVPARGKLVNLPSQGLLDGSLTKTLSDAGFSRNNGEEWLDVVALSTENATRLERSPGHAFMRVTRTAYDTNDNLVEHAISLLDPDHFRFHHAFSSQEER